MLGVKDIVLEEKKGPGGKDSLTHVACVSGMWHRGMKAHVSHHPYMGDGAISANRYIIVLSRTFHMLLLQRRGERTRCLLERK